jgi:uncharacterized membrane protein YgcG
MPPGRRFDGFGYRALGLAFALALTMALLPGTASASSSCLTGSWSATGTDSPNPCDPADFGHYAIGPGATSQTACDPGSYDPITDSSAVSDCLRDPAGGYSQTGAEDATLCPSGTFDPNSGSTSAAACLPAHPGYFADTDGSSAEVPCAAGSYSSSTGSTTCTLAPPGFFVAETGATAATVCPEGTWTTKSGERACTPLPTLGSGGGSSGGGGSGGGGSGGGSTGGGSGGGSGAAQLSVQKVVKLGHGEVRLVLHASRSGAFAASASTISVGSRYGKATVAGSGAGATITIKPNRAAAKLLAHSASVRISVVVTFTPKAGGSPVTRTVVVKLRGKKH